MDRFGRGDDDAVRSLYQQYGRLVFTIAIRILGDRQLAENATQQVFVEAWRAASSFESAPDPALWLATLTRRVSMEMHRSSDHRPVDTLKAISGRTLVSHAPSSEEVWKTWQVRAAIDDLPSDEREVVRLRHVEGESENEIATKLRLPIGTVRSRSYRGHRRLANRLQHLRLLTVEE
jgi:RNA polymerase sigma factor (sigma-70 family)